MTTRHPVSAMMTERADMNDHDVAFLLKSISVLMKVLSTRLLLIVTLMLTFALFAWAAYIPDYWRLSVATIFALLVFLPVQRADSKQGASHEHPQTP